MKTSDILKKAWALIDAPEKWCQGKYQNNRGQHCSVGAVVVTLGCTVSGGVLGHAESLGQAEFERHMGPFRLAVPGGDDIVGFNGHHSWEEVRTVWMSAIEIAEDQEIAEEIRQMAVPVEEPPEQPQPEPEPEQVLA